MSTEKQAVTVRDLAEEAKKRIVFSDHVCLRTGFSHVMVLIFLLTAVVVISGYPILVTVLSSSVWVNLPAAAFLIIILRYLSVDFEMRRKAAIYNNKPPSANMSSLKKPPEGPKAVVKKSDWRRKVNSPVVEDALNQFTRHIVYEWVTDLWYSRLTPDRQGPEELVQILNSVLGEISSRARNVNLIDLLTRDIINIFCTHLELFRANQEQITPALFSTEAEHKVLQRLMDGLISFTFKPEDLQCSLFRFIVRELLACALMRPVLNLANPRFINERIESLVISLSKSNKGAATTQEASQSKSNGSSRISSNRFVDPSIKGVELVQFKKDQSKTSEEKSATDDMNGTLLSKNPLLSVDMRSTSSWSSLPSASQTGDGRDLQRPHTGGQWADNSRVLTQQNERDGATKISSPENSAVLPRRNDQSVTAKFSDDDLNLSSHISSTSYVEDDEHDLMRIGEVESGSRSYTSEDEENSSVTGLDSPGTKVWDGKNNRNLSVSHVCHPLESSEGNKTRKTANGHVHSRLHRTHSRRKRSRLSSQKLHEMLNLRTPVMIMRKEMLARIQSGTTASSPASSTSTLDSHNLALNAQKNTLLVDSFLKLRCEVLGANIVKSGSRTFTVYSISITDINNNSWSIKRRFQHFEELHRCLKEFSEYNLHLPPKHFLSTVDLDGTPRERSEEGQDALGPPVNQLSSQREQRNVESKESPLPMKHNFVTDGSKLKAQGTVHSPQTKCAKEFGKPFEDSAPRWWMDQAESFLGRQTVLQLGMGDAFDDWLIEKIQLLRRGSVVASGIRRIEQILWPDGIFITKHPKRKRPNPSASTPQSSPRGRPPTPVSSPKDEDTHKFEEKQHKEAEQRAKFVYELMIDNAPAVIVGLVGHKEYEQCAKDLYYFLQSSVCLKQLAFDLLELLLLSAFPEMDDIFRQLHEQKEMFGEFKPA
ncbi:phox (PX) domain-containing protein [Actinidia rufa]|uniref:Phox (PX) domain-containing protein n=1 Tax=Actinidia rufa TaxID=165716 RepID=A0A7J0GBB8_9ERIC|nr:phox (PX) domain-containing protein [Actinidia rufa]